MLGVDLKYSTMPNVDLNFTLSARCRALCRNNLFMGRNIVVNLKSTIPCWNKSKTYLDLKLAFYSVVMNFMHSKSVLWGTNFRLDFLGGY